MLADFGVSLPADTEIRVWDSTAETRFLVLPMRPAGTDGWDEERLAALVTRDSMIGTGLAKRPERGGSMNGVHDMGGMDGFGKVEPEANEPVFHAPWEGRVIAMMRAMGAVGAWNLDMFRDAREHQPAAFYLATSYYKSWAKSIEMLMLSRGLATPDEIAAGHSLHPAKSVKRAALRAEDVARSLKRGSYGRPAASAPALFKVGDRVRAKNMHPTTHTRLPRYVRGRVGVVERVHGCHVFPGQFRARRRRRPAMALHRGLRRPRVVGRRRRPGFEGLHRRF